MRNQSRLIIYVVVLAVLAALVWMSTTPRKETIRETNISEITQVINEGTVDHIDVDGNRVTASLKNGTTLLAFKESGVSLGDYGVTPDKVKNQCQKSRSEWFGHRPLVPDTLPLHWPDSLVYVSLGPGSQRSRYAVWQIKCPGRRPLW